MSRPVRMLAAAAVVALTAGLLPLVAIASGAASADPIYEPVPRFKADGPRVRVRPDRYSAVRIDVPRVRSRLRDVPRVGSGKGSRVFRVPTPAGSTERFAIQRTTVMQPRLAAAHPGITTYAGRSLDHVGTSVALDVTPLGFHAAVRGPQGQRAWFVDPAFDRRGTTLHLSYYGGEVDRGLHSFVEREAPQLERARADRVAGSSRAPGRLVDQRAYRLALVSDPTYAAYFGTENVLAEKVTLINRVNQIYNQDLAISLRLINATDKLNLDTDAEAVGPNGPCGAHPCFDPGTATTEGQLDYCTIGGLLRNRTVLSQLVGASSYDIGHLALGLNGGGVANLGVVGQDFKAQGCTGIPTPQGDFFAIDYVAHEMGHQFHGNHTFNGIQYACAGGNRNVPTSVEPGSGSSVMAYAGICLQDDLQPHSDPYFSQRSIEEISTYTGTPGTPVIEVQTVSLRGFDTDGETVQIGWPGKAPITLTRGVDYDAAGIEAAVETLTGKDVTVAQWGYDPFDTQTDDLASPLAPDDTGFQVIFAPTVDPFAENASTDLPALQVSSSSAGVTGFVGETAKGGPPQNTGYRVITTRNHAPRVAAPADTTLPLRTPFTLRGSGRDADGNRLTYLWEQNDIGAPDAQDTEGGTSLVDNDKENGPLFRIFGTYADVTDEGTLLSPSPGENRATSRPSRTFPDLRQVLSRNTNARTGTCPEPPPLPADLNDYVPVAPAIRDCFSEFLPVKGYVGTAGSKTPAMHFRLTARDGHVNGAGTAHDDVTLRLDQRAGPFLVTSQSTRVTREGGRHMVVRWDVNGTRRLAARVRILLSTDGGVTWRRVLARSTVNDGVRRVRLPDVATGRARIEVESVGNYFFAVNDRSFRIR
jgi:hypothetical protein